MPQGPRESGEGSHLQHLVSVPQGLLHLGELELQDTVRVLLPLELLQEETATLSF